MKSLYLSLLWLFGPLCVFGQFPKPINLAQSQKEYQQAVARRDTPAIAEAAYMLGKRYRGLGDYVASRRRFLECLKLREPLGPSIELNKLYVQLAADFSGTLTLHEAFSYGYRALDNSRLINHAHSQMSAYNLMSQLHWTVAQGGQGKMDTLPNPVARQLAVDSALWYVQRAEAIAIRLRKPLDIASARTVKARILLDRDPRQAIALLNYARNFYEREDHHNSVVLNLTLGETHLTLGQLPQARNHLLAAEKWFRQLREVDTYLPAEIQLAWSDWHRTAGNWQQAYEYRQRADSLNEAARIVEQRAKITQLNAAYEADRREAELKTQRAENALQKNQLAQQDRQTRLLWSLLVIVLVVGGVFFWLYRENRRKSKQIETLLDERSHRMDNTLQAISGMLGMQSAQLTDQEARQAIEASRLRVQTMSSLHRMLNDSHRLQSLGLPAVITDVVRAVLDSYGYETVQPQYELDEVSLQPNQAIPIALILNELATNACKYAFPQNPAPALVVRCWQEGQQIRLQVWDNGPGLVQTTEQKGFGSILIALQVQQLEGKCSISGPPGVTFDLSMKIKRKKQIVENMLD